MSILSYLIRPLTKRRPKWAGKFVSEDVARNDDGLLPRWKQTSTLYPSSLLVLSLLGLVAGLADKFYQITSLSDITVELLDLAPWVSSPIRGTFQS